MWALIIAISISGVIAPFFFPSDFYEGSMRYFSEPFFDQLLRLQQSPLSDASHRLIGIALLVLGMIQFNEDIRRTRPRLHRWTGRLYMVLATIVVVTAMDLVVQYAFGGFVEMVAIGLISFAFAFFVILGFIKIREKDFAGHRESMMRGFGILMFVTVQRPFFIIMSSVSNFEVVTNFLWAGGFALATTTLITEWWIRHTQRTDKPDATV
tara:strand:- start:625 stop:1254 length:630 start_codon:yes stop_codon:yes gene_type:complete